jgi:hypothetical protein
MKQPTFCEGEILIVHLVGHSFSFENGFFEKGEPFEKDECIIILDVTKRGKTIYYLVQYADNICPVEMSEHYIAKYKIVEQTKPHHKTDDNVQL